jgi:hypothetical protein
MFHQCGWCLSVATADSDFGFKARLTHFTPADETLRQPDSQNSLTVPHPEHTTETVPFRSLLSLRVFLNNAPAFGFC